MQLPRLVVDEATGEARSRGEIEFEGQGLTGEASEVIYGLAGQPTQLFDPVLRDSTGAELRADRIVLLDGLNDVELTGNVDARRGVERFEADRLHAVRDEEDRLRHAEAEGGVPPEVRERYNIGRQGNPVFGQVFSRPATACGGTLKGAALLRDGGIVHSPAGGTESAGGEWLAVYARLLMEMDYRPRERTSWLALLRIQGSFAAGPALGGDGGSMWQVRASATIQFTEAFGFMFGYRLVELNVDNGAYTLDGGLQGLFVAGSLKF